MFLSFASNHEQLAIPLNDLRGCFFIFSPFSNPENDILSFNVIWLTIQSNNGPTVSYTSTLKFRLDGTKINVENEASC